MSPHKHPPCALRLDPDTQREAGGRPQPAGAHACPGSGMDPSAQLMGTSPFPVQVPSLSSGGLFTSCRATQVSALCWALGTQPQRWPLVSHALGWPEPFPSAGQQAPHSKPRQGPVCGDEHPPHTPGNRFGGTERLGPTVPEFRSQAFCGCHPARLGQPAPRQERAPRRATVGTRGQLRWSVPASGPAPRSPRPTPLLTPLTSSPLF